MKFQFVVLLFGSIILSTNLSAIEMKGSTSPAPSNKTLQKNTAEDHFKRLKKIQQHNMIFDNYSTGSSVPYEENK